MKTKDLINWIKLFIKFSKKFIKGFASNNLLIYELQNILSKISLIKTKKSDPINLIVSNIIYVDGLIYSFILNNVIYSINPSNVNLTIENITSLRNFFKNTFNYYLYYEKDLILKINSSIDIMNQTYSNISDILANLKHGIESQIQNIDLLNIYLGLVYLINKKYKFPKLFKFKGKTIDLLYFNKYDYFQKIIVCKINLITLNKFFDELAVDYSSDSNSENFCMSESVSSLSSESSTGNFSKHCNTLKYTVFKKNKISKKVFNDYVIKIGTNSVRINSNTIKDPNILLQLNCVINEINESITKISGYKTYIHTYEISAPVEIKKNVFSKQKCFYLQEFYEKFIGFLCILNVDIENLHILSQIESCESKIVIPSSLQNIINNLYVRLYDLVSISFQKLSISIGDSNTNVYYVDENSCLLFFGILNVPVILVEKDCQNNIKFIQVNFSTQIIKIEMLKNKIVPKNFSTVLINLIRSIHIIKTLVEFDLKNLSDLIILLK